MECSSENERFMRLFARDEQRLRRYIFALVPFPGDVDDILQDTAVALMRKFEQYDPSQPFFPWASRFALFEVMRHRKQARTRRRHFSSEVVDAIAAEHEHHQIQADDRRAALADCLRALGDHERRLVEFRYGSDESIEEVSRRLQEPAARLYRSLARIRAALAACVRRKLALEVRT